MEKLELVNKFLNIIKEIDKVQIYSQSNKIIIVPSEGEEWLIPRIFIKDAYDLEDALMEYLDTIIKSDIRSTKLDEKHDKDYYLWILIKNLSNSDCEDFCAFVRKHTQFFSDRTFSEYATVKELATLGDGYTLEVKRSEEYYGTETPYILLLWKKNKNIKYEMPIIRYGIYYDEKSGEQVARIYAIQQKKQYKETDIIRNVRKTFSSVNYGINKFRNVPPSMVATFAVFCGLLYSRGIKNIEVVDYIPRRYLRFRDATTDEERNRIQSHATDIFIKIALKATMELDGVTVTAYPNEVDSSMHILLDDRIGLNSNENLNTMSQYLNAGLGSVEKENTL